MPELINPGGAATAASPARPLRRQFALPEEDVSFLDSLNLLWETILEGRARWLLIHDYPLPEGYTTLIVSVAILISPAYPSSPLDMAYFNPAIRLASGRAIPNADTQQPLDGQVWQRWSRHRTGANSWQPGIDCVKTHLALIQAWLECESKR